jgi:hypothetical protein
MTYERAVHLESLLRKMVNSCPRCNMGIEEFADMDNGSYSEVMKMTLPGIGKRKCSNCSEAREFLEMKFEGQVV